MRVELPKGKYAEITPLEELSERSCRAIDKAMLKVGMISIKVKEAGFDPDKVTLAQLYELLPDDEMDALKSYHDALLVNMVYEWDVLPALPTPDTVTDISRPVFEALVTACNEEFTKGTDFGSEGKDDPKADGGN